MKTQNVLSYAEVVRSACARVVWLEHIFASIANDSSVSTHTKSLAETGHFIAGDVAEFVENACIDLVAEIQKGGAA